MAKILVVGGAGYIGSSVTAWLIDNGHEVGIIDDLSTGHRELVLSDNFLHADMSDAETVRPWLEQQETPFEIAMLFAAKTQVEESVADPERYFQTNVTKLEQLLRTLCDVGIKRVVFSSSCVIFADTKGKPIHEEAPLGPGNPYGEQKLEMERRLKRMSQEEQLQVTVLRYFNAAGAEPNCRVGEWHEPESHLIPRILQRAHQPDPPPMMIFGTDYPTEDGTCVRDYVHVWSLAKAHASAMTAMLQMASTDGCFHHYNVGTGRGFSVREVIEMVEQVTGKDIVKEEHPRRPGDASILIADPRKAIEELNFEPLEFTLEEIISHAWQWEQKRQQLADKSQSQ